MEEQDVSEIIEAASDFNQSGMDFDNLGAFDVCDFTDNLSRTVLAAEVKADSVGIVPLGALSGVSRYFAH